MHVTYRPKADLQNSLQDYPFTATRIEELESQIDRHVESMTYEHVSQFGVLSSAKDTGGKGDTNEIAW